MRVLLIEDDETLGAAVRDHMSAQRNAVDWANNVGDAGLSLITVEYGLILLDLRLPDGSGLTLLKNLRSSGNHTPVIILTAHDQISDRIEGLNSGADDYIVKPFDLNELTARMLAVTRRHAGSSGSFMNLGKLRINVADRRIVSESGEIVLTGREWAVFDRLLLRIGAVVSKSQIEEALYAFGSEIESNTVEVYVSRLRKKLGRSVVSTVRGVGYRIEELS
ncbi:response regulator [Ochrobactrum chromiisoli]|uniref:Response regulator n=1 Tax=Ochrobactrum chromiisoli TaxID=2993941 RepID=A0ABT3QSQ9_9HYPH|nr:response regulator [Ochrobactrum chromiisoli]MCX2698667.1 response regulator [Ochrobactrum chromiisoli]